MFDDGILKTDKALAIDKTDWLTARCGGCWRTAADIGGVIVANTMSELRDNLDLIGWAWDGVRWLCPKCQRIMRAGTPLFSDR